MKIVRDNFVCRWAGVIAVVVVFSNATISDAAMLVPTSISGAISYGYGYTRSGGGGSGESQSITGSISGAGYYWQPWFISLSAGLTLAFGRTDYSTASSTSNTRAWGGSLGVDVFPVSRFPFSLSLSHTNSFLENSQALTGSASRTFTSTRLLARQSYLSRSGYISHLSWSHGRFDSEGSTSTSNVYSADTRKNFTESAIMASANYTTSHDSNSSTKPRNWGVQFSHNYVPGNQFGLSNFVSAAGSKTQSDISLARSQSTQASSSFSWRPEYKPYSFSGGARIAYNKVSQQTDTTDTKSSSNLASLSLGVNYRLSRKISVLMTAGGSGGYGKNEGTETSTTTANASLGTSYSSDQYSIAGFQYGWSVGGGLGGDYSSQDVSGTTTESETKRNGTLGLNAGHHASRSWAIGRATVVGLTLSQNIGGSRNDKGRGSEGLGEGASISGSTRGRSGSSFAGISLSHSYSQTDPAADSNSNDKVKSQSLFASMNVSRNQTINRLSAMTANAGLQWSKQAVSGEDSFVNRTANANLSYRHQRVFGIYSLYYNSNASYSVLLNPGRDRLANMYWNNSFQYNVGLLDMALEVQFDRQANSDTNMSLRFRATRTF